jgi:hypothetical protein
MVERNAARLRRPSWRDPRLGVGVLLVAGSVALGSWVVAGADRTVAVYQARDTLSPGTRIDVEALDVVQVRLDAVDATYLVPGADLPADAVVLRTVGEDELLPVTAVGSAAELDLRPVQVPMTAALQTSVGTGSRIDLWVAVPDGSGPTASLLPPELLVGDVEVAAVHEDTSVFAGSGEVQVQVLVPLDDLPAVLAALGAEGSSVTVVPLPGSSG